MRVKPARHYLPATTRPAWQRLLIGAARGATTALRVIAFSPVWSWMGGLIQQGALRLERWVGRW